MQLFCYPLQNGDIARYMSPLNCFHNFMTAHGKSLFIDLKILWGLELLFWDFSYLELPHASLTSICKRLKKKKKKIITKR